MTVHKEKKNAEKKEKNLYETHQNKLSKKSVFNEKENIHNRICQSFLTSFLSSYYKHIYM